MAKAGHDYDIAKLMRGKGLTYNKIAEQTGIPFKALCRFAQRHNWDKERDKVVASLSHVVSRDMTQFAQRHILKITEFGDKALDNLIARGFDMPLSDLQTLFQVANTCDAMIRRAHQMDAASQHKASSLVQVNVTSNGTHTSWTNGDTAQVMLADSDAPECNDTGDAQVLDVQPVMHIKPAQ